MLVLTRKSGESIVIGEQIVVTVLEVRGDHVRIGIQAPRAVEVHREEIARRVEGENVAAAASAQRARALLAARPLPPRRPAAAPEPRPPDAGRPRPPASGDG